MERTATEKKRAGRKAGCTLEGYCHGAQPSKGNLIIGLEPKLTVSCERNSRSPFPITAYK
jgi:hypothetical protein